VISRLYGEHGPEILDALRRNPVGTIPVILKRLKQKDVDWREARHKMHIQVSDLVPRPLLTLSLCLCMSLSLPLSQWKEVLVKNYDKSLDHRSYIFK
jgi:paired amphipathic helix protein Sin3a